ncbi:hypothetical protein [Thiohalorhabdus methylotrophus]|uniref:Aminotransferase class V-fold PLP-dependent enzyme n=1 Tax=Thiohalorhabdus methylotrophus TaxID=3242694 RepID=A0ABV4TTU0_9GAMM
MSAPPSRRFGFPDSPPDPRVMARFTEALEDNVNSYGMHCRPPGPLENPYRDLERRLVADAARFVGLPEDTLGYVCGGASEAALFAAWTARKMGIRHVLVSRNAHASTLKAAEVAGLDGGMMRAQAPLTAAGVAEALARLPDDAPLWAALTWVNPIHAETDDLEGVVRLLRERPAPTLVFVDGAVGGLLGPAVRGETLAGLDVDVLGMDFHKLGQAPVGTGLLLYRPGLHELVRTPGAYLPYGEDTTLVGSRNAAFAAAATASLELAADGTLGARFEALRPWDAALRDRLGEHLAARLFPYYLLDGGPAPLGEEDARALAAFGIHPMEVAGRVRIRICLAPGQDPEAFEALLARLERTLPRHSGVAAP